LKAERKLYAALRTSGLLTWASRSPAKKALDSLKEEGLDVDEINASYYDTMR